VLQVLDPRPLLDEAAILAARYGGGSLICETLAAGWPTAAACTSEPPPTSVPACSEPPARSVSPSTSPPDRGRRTDPPQPLVAPGQSLVAT
jgi:hypothetical protein